MFKYAKNLCHFIVLFLIPQRGKKYGNFLVSDAEGKNNSTLSDSLGSKILHFLKYNNVCSTNITS